MARRASKNRGSVIAEARPVPERRLGTSEARAALPSLVKELSEQTEASASLADNAIEVGVQRKGGAWLVSEVDAQAAVERVTELERQVVSLEDEVENIALGLLIQERLENSDAGTTPGVEVIRELGFDDLLEGLPTENPSE